MKKTGTILSVVFLLILLCGCKPEKTFTEKEIALIPQANRMIPGESSFRFSKRTQFVVENVDQAGIAGYLAEMFDKAAGWKLKIIFGADEASNQLHFKTDITLFPEAYSLDVQANRIEIRAAKPAGFFYAVQTLRQLLPGEIEGNFNQDTLKWLVPALKINDGPKFAWRGMMLDVSRHFFPKEDLFRIIDLMAFHKLNTLQLHLVDDQGWRIEIKKYPKLTEVGAWRVNREDLPWNSRPVQQAGETASYGGFYTQDDIREIVAYAASRFITVVPEIEMPAHVTSALAAYPQYSCTGGPFTVLPGGVWPITDIYCAGKDSTFHFLEDVLTEIMELFPSKYIHIGGDEATKTEWAKCPECKKRIKSEDLTDASGLQAYFIRRIEQFIRSKDRILLGWDEILEGGLPPEAVVMSWRGIAGGLEAARNGHDVVMSPNTFCYFDYYQGPKNSEPPAIGGHLPLSRVYQFNPVPEELETGAAKHILGGQANLWTEYIPDLKQAEYMLFPRLTALSEKLWSSPEVQQWNDFSRRVQLIMQRYDQMNLNYSKSAYSIQAKTTLAPDGKQLAVSLSNEFPDAIIYFTLNESEPSNRSMRYTEPIVVEKSTKLKAIAVDYSGKETGQPLTQPIIIHKATAKTVQYISPFSPNYPGGGQLTLVNGLTGSENLSDGEWQGWEGSHAELIIDLGELVPVGQVSIGALHQPRSWVFLPSKVECLLSTDGEHFTRAGECLPIAKPTGIEPVHVDYFVQFGPVSTRYIKVIARNIGQCPKGHSGEGKPAWLFLDEIQVY